MLCSGQSAVVHSVSQPIAVASPSCLFENIIVEHFTVLKNFQACLGPQISACFAQVKVPWFIPSVSQLQLHLLHVYLKTLLLSTSQC